jgi:plastocyanin
MERTITGSIVVIGAAAVLTAGALFFAPDDASPAAPIAPSAPAAGRQPAGARAGRTPSVVTPTLEISDFSFSDITVAPGAVVPVVNRDGTAHTVTAVDGSFDVAVKGGTAGSFTAPSQAGSYALVCSIHPSMSGVLTVTP